MISGNEGESRQINKSDITKVLDQVQANYEYKEFNLSKVKEVCDTIMEVLDYSSKHSINGESEIDKEGGKANSCVIF
jgi:hypothetical protein